MSRDGHIRAAREQIIFKMSRMRRLIDDAACEDFSHDGQTYLADELERLALRIADHCCEMRGAAPRQWQRQRLVTAL